MDEAISAALRAAEKAPTKTAAVIAFLNALPGGGLYVNSGMISRPQMIADAVEAAVVADAYRRAAQEGGR